MNTEPKEEFKPFIVHFEYLTPCPKCGKRWSGMYKLEDGSYLCAECFEAGGKGDVK